VLRAKKRSKGFSFAATDVSWSWGDGPRVEGPGEAILMTLLGRAQPLDELSGEGAAAYAARVRAPN
jgi:hypothetical protein